MAIRRKVSRVAAHPRAQAGARRAGARVGSVASAPAPADGRGQGVPDLIAPDLKLLFVGINPGLYTAASGRHFAHPANRFWPALHAGGFTDRMLSPFEGHALLDRGYGITNLVGRATRFADEVSAAELRAGVERLAIKVRRYRPRMLAILGVTSYRLAFGRARAQVGRQAEQLEGVSLWLLPNPSGLNAHYVPGALARVFRALYVAIEAGR